MKASEVLTRYATGERDFKGATLRGQSFKGQNLSGADFSKADIRSTNFTDANLRGAKFCGAKCGLQKRWATILIIVSWLLPALSGFFSLWIGLLAVSAQFTNIKKNWLFILVYLILLLVFSLFSIRKGLVASFKKVAFAMFPGVLAGVIAGIAFAVARAGVSVAVAVNVAGVALASAVAITVSILAVFLIAGVFVSVVTVAGTIAVAIAGVTGVVPVAGVGVAGVALAFVFASTSTEDVLNVAEVPTVVGVGVAQAFALALLGAYLGWRAMKGDKRDAWVRSFAIAFAATRGTSFRDADLTEANFTRAKLKSTDLRKTILIRSRWYQAKKLDQVRPGTTYLKSSKVRQLLITSEGQNQDFNRLDLRGVNLQGANLENASFIDADFYQANLQGAYLSRAILVRTNFERADLRNINLTGSCIQDWTISRGTKLNGIICEYVYLKWVDGDKRDQMPPRGKFKKGGFALFIRYILDTIDLYHDKDINPRLALSVLKKMSKNYHESLDIVAVGKRDERVFIKVKISEDIEPERFKEKYFSTYDEGLKFLSANNKQLPSVDELVENRIAEITSEQTNEISSINVTHIEYMKAPKDLVIQGEVIVENIEAEGDIINQSGNFGIGKMSGGEIKEGAKVAGVINEAEKQNLADAATEIQQLLEQLSNAYPTTTSKEKNIVVGEVVDQIENNPTLKAKVINALKAGGTEAFKEAIDHPLVNILVATIEGWLDGE